MANYNKEAKELVNELNTCALRDAIQDALETAYEEGYKDGYDKAESEWEAGDTP